MIINSHLLLANMIYDSTLHHVPFSTPLNAFRYGNIKPDLVRKLVKSKHYYNSSKDFFTNSINKLVNSNLSNSDFCEQSGIITHLISDYFCKYHYYENLQHKSIIEHLNYEFLLQKNLVKLINSKLTAFRQKEKLYSKTQIIDYLEDMQKKYPNIKDSPIKDITMALNVSTNILNSIINNSKEEIVNITSKITSHSCVNTK